MSQDPHIQKSTEGHSKVCWPHSYISNPFLHISNLQHLSNLATVYIVIVVAFILKL